MDEPADNNKATQRSRDPLHGVTLEKILNRLVDKLWVAGSRFAEDRWDEKANWSWRTLGGRAFPLVGDRTAGPEVARDGHDSYQKRDIVLCPQALDLAAVGPNVADLASDAAANGPNRYLHGSPEVHRKRAFRWTVANPNGHPRIGDARFMLEPR